MGSKCWGLMAKHQRVFNDSSLHAAIQFGPILRVKGFALTFAKQNRRDAFRPFGETNSY